MKVITYIWYWLEDKTVCFMHQLLLKISIHKLQIQSHEKDYTGGHDFSFNLTNTSVNHCRSLNATFLMGEGGDVRCSFVLSPFFMCSWGRGVGVGVGEGWGVGVG